MGKNKEGRILVAINQADVAMKGRYWDYEKNEPQKTLKEFLDKKVISVKERIKEGTGINIEPIYYSAGFKEDGQLQTKPYNLSKLLYFIIKATPKEKRLAYVDTINPNDEMWKDNDDIKDYGKEIQNSFAETVKDCATTGSDIGERIGEVFGESGKRIGRVAGGIIGGVVGVGKAIWHGIFG